MTKPKALDCVETKRRAQERLQAEYESREAEFSSYVDFVAAKANESEWVRRMRARLRS